ncbi:MAG TPA: alpha/beta fold hydrolase [Opitutaceae bacterium]
MHGGPKRPFCAAGAVLALALGLSGCATQILAKRIVQAPNHNGPPRMARDEKAAATFAKTYSQTFTVPVGPPAASLSVAILEPGNYSLKYALELKKNPSGGGQANYSINWSFPDPRVPKPPAKGTIVLLHGVLVSKEYMVHWALYLAQKGYRTVLVDLRGHGRSTGRWITFGAVERTDLEQVLDELHRRGLADRPIGVLGISYGAAVGIDWAAIDPRVGSVVALEPFCDPREAIAEFARGYDPGSAKGISDAQFAIAEDRAAQLAGFIWADADVLESTRRLKVPVLFFHGAEDTWIPPSHSRRLVEAAPIGSRLEIVKDDNHLTLSVRLDPIAAEVAGWFDSHLPR